MIRLTPEHSYALLDDPIQVENARVSIDLENQKIKRPDGEEIDFDVDPFRKHCLLQGLDDIGITLQSDEKIGLFEEKQKSLMPWMRGARC